MAFDPDSYLASKTAPSDFSPDSYLSGHYDQLAADKTFDPVANYAANPSVDSLTTSREVFKRRAAQPTSIGSDIVDAAKVIPGAAVGTVTGLAKGLYNAAGNIGTELTEPEGSPEAQRAQRENAAAIQLGAMQGGDLVSGAWRNAQRLFGKTDRTLSDQEINDQITHEAAHRAVQQSLTAGNVVEGGAAGHLGFNAVAQTQTPEELAAKGSPIRPDVIENESFLGNPATYAVPALAEGAGPLVGKLVTSPLLRGVGAAVEGTGNLLSKLSHGKGTAAGLAGSLFTHNPIAAVGGVSADLAAKNLPGLGRILTQAGEEAAGAAPPVGQSLVAKGLKGAAQGAVSGAAMSVPFVAAAQSPEEAGQAIGGGFGLGAVLGGAGAVGQSRKIDVAAKFNQLANEGANINYGLGWDDANTRGISQLSPQDQATVNAYRARFNGMADKNGIPVQIYAVGGPDYAKALSENGGGAATDTRGFISPDGTKIFLNADAAKAPGRTDVTLGHEAGGHLTEFLGEIAQSHDISTLQDTLANRLYNNGKPIPQFDAFMRQYKASLLNNGATQAQVDALDPQYFQKEFLAEHAAKILSGENIANFHLPKPLTERITQGVSDWLRNQGILPQEGGKIGFGGTEIHDITSQLRDVLYNQGKQSETLRTQRAESTTQPSPSVAYRMEQLRTILNKPITPASTVDEVKARQAAQKEYDDLSKATQKQPFPASGAPPAAPSKPTAPPAPAGVNATQIAAILNAQFGIPKVEAMQWAAKANGANIQEQVADALKQRANQKFPTQPAPANPATPPQPTPPQPAPQGVPAFVSKAMEQQLADLGYTKAERNKMTPAEAMDVINKGVSKPVQPATPNVRPSEPTPPASNEPIPPSGGTTVQAPPEPAVPAAPNPLSEEDVNRIAAETEAQVRAARQGTKKKEATLPGEITAAQVDAVAKAHSEGLPANYQGVRMRVDQLGKQSITGTFNPSRPFDAFLMKMADLSDHAKGILQNLQDKIGQTVTLNYNHAPQGAGDVINESRKVAQKNSPAEERASGMAQSQAEDKNMVPLTFAFNKGTGGRSPSITVVGASPEKLLNNFNLAGNAVQELGGEVPYNGIHDPALQSDIHAVAQNHQNGWKGDGSAPIKGFPDYPVSPTPDYQPTKIPPDRFDFLNLILGDESAKTGSKRQTPEQQLKQGLAAKNAIPMTEAGETNILRESINRAKGPQVDSEGKPISWSKLNLENPLSEALRVDLINGLKEEEAPDQSIRPHGFQGDISQFFKEGSPNRTFTAAGFQPDELTTPKEKAQDRLLSRIAQDNGAVYQGKQGDLHAFKDEQTGGNFSVKSQDLSEDKIKAEAERVRQSFEGENIDTPEKLDAFLKSLQFQPEDTGTPEEGGTPAERLAREAEEAGVMLSMSTLRSLIRGDSEVMDKIRSRIQDKTGKPARFQPEELQPYNPDEENTPIIKADIPAWLQRYDHLSEKENDDKLTKDEETELTKLHKRVVKEYGSYMNFIRQYDQGEPAKKTPQELARERIAARAEL